MDLVPVLYFIEKDDVTLKKITWMTKAVKAGRTLPAAAILVLLSAILSGCLYPDNQAQNNRVSYVESVRNLQAAVDDYYQQEGVLPIITAGPEIPAMRNSELTWSS